MCTAYLSTYLPTPAFLSETLVSALWVSSRFLMAAMLAYALYLILRHWREDLVERRRLLRLTVVLIVCGQIVGVVAVETIMGTGVVPQWVEVANSAGIVLSSLIFVSAMVLLGPEQLMRVSVDEPEQLPVADQREVGKIVEVMEHDHIYRDMALTIRGLAVKVDIPEHRLRQRINQQLDYRNFNDFLNHYRIAEVTSRLCDPDSARTPVLTIAMDAGYRSMTTFNKAFKARHSLTPVEYRQKHLPIP